MTPLRRVLFAVLLALLAATGVAACGNEDEPAPPGVALPEDFPRAQVPLVGGTIQAADRAGDGEWTVTVQAPSNDGNAYDNAVTKLKDAGYEENSPIETQRERGVMLRKSADGDTYWVTVGITAAAQGGANTILYTVTRE